MAIKSSTIFNKQRACFEGFVNFGEDIIVDDENRVATEALVFMLVGLKGHWKYPVGYVFCDKVNSEDLKCLISRILTETKSRGINVHSITMDGTTVNINAMKLLGCKIGNTKDDLDGSFNFDGYDYKIYFILDACHMLKLGRNALSDLGVFVDGDGQKIKWSHIQNLHDLQEEEGLTFGNKLSKSSIHYHRQKMKVKIAAQTLSSSVADALEFLMCAGHPSFEDAAGTIKFIRAIDKVFDILNSRTPFSKGYKQAIRLSSENYIIDSLDSITEYLLSLRTLSGQRLIDHRRKTFVIGFIIAAKGVVELSKKLLRRCENPFAYILTYKFSQDHIELLFSTIRGRNGFNNNPNVQQFKSSLRSNLMRVSLIGSKQGNCSTFEEEPQNSLFSLKWTKRRTPLVTDRDESSLEADIPTNLIGNQIMTPYKEAILGYIGGYIVRSMLKDISCIDCADALLLNDDDTTNYGSYHRLIFVKDRGGLISPSADVCKILTVAEKYFRHFISGLSSDTLTISASGNSFNKLCLMILSELYTRPLFKELSQHDKYNDILTEDIHSSQLTKTIVKKYLTIRFFRYGQQYTRDVIQDKKLGYRQQATKLVLFKGL